MKLFMACVQIHMGCSFCRTNAYAAGTLAGVPHAHARVRRITIAYIAGWRNIELQGIAVLQLCLQHRQGKAIAPILAAARAATVCACSCTMVGCALAALRQLLCRARSGAPNVEPGAGCAACKAQIPRLFVFARALSAAPAHTATRVKLHRARARQAAPHTRTPSCTPHAKLHPARQVARTAPHAEPHRTRTPILLRRVRTLNYAQHAHAPQGAERADAEVVGLRNNDLVRRVTRRILLDISRLQSPCTRFVLRDV
eukprot:2506582-Pleurochrysis_carterae.AAC.1